MKEDALKTFFVFVFTRHLEDVFKTPWSRRIYSPYSYGFRKTSPRRLQDVLIKANMFVLVTRVQDFFKTSERLLAKTSYRRPQDVFKTSSNRLEDVFKISSRSFAKTYLRHLEDVFKTFWKCLQGRFKSSSRRLAKMPTRRFQDVLSS